MLHLDTSIMRALPLSPAQLSFPLTPPAQIWSSPTVTCKACCLHRIYKRVQVELLISERHKCLIKPLGPPCSLYKRSYSYDACKKLYDIRTSTNSFFEEKNYSGYAQSFPVLDQPVGAWRACCNVPGPLLAPAFYFHVKNGSKAESEMWIHLDKV